LRVVTSQKTAVSCPFGHLSVHGYNLVDVAVHMQGTLRELPSNAEMIGTLKIVYEVQRNKQKPPGAEDI
jgi:hypothetical protein